MSLQKPPDRTLVFLCTLVFHALATSGRAVISPDTRLYIELADGFLAHDASGTFDAGAVRWTKSLYILLLALARASSPMLWPTLMVTLNVISSAFLAVLLVDLTSRICRRPIASWSALLLYLGCFELFRWMRFIVTDLPFALAAFVPFYLVARHLMDGTKSPRPLPLVLSLLIAAFTRPPGVLLIPLVLFVETTLICNRPRLRVAVVLIIALAVTALFVRTAVVYQPSLWPVHFVKPKIEEFAGREKAGEVVFGRPETSRRAPASAGEHVVIVADRLVRFFQVTSSAYSFKHNAVNVAFLFPLYALGTVAIASALRPDAGQRRLVVVALLAWLLAFASFHALTILDSEWRYRAPLMPHFILLAAIGLDELAQGFGGKRLIGGTQSNRREAPTHRDGSG